MPRKKLKKRSRSQSTINNTRKSPRLAKRRKIDPIITPSPSPSESPLLPSPSESPLLSPASSTDNDSENYSDNDNPPKNESTSISIKQIARSSDTLSYETPSKLLFLSPIRGKKTKVMNSLFGDRTGVIHCTSWAEEAIKHHHHLNIGDTYNVRFDSSQLKIFKNQSYNLGDKPFCIDNLSIIESINYDIDYVDLGLQTIEDIIKNKPKRANVLAIISDKQDMKFKKTGYKITLRDETGVLPYVAFCATDFDESGLIEDDPILLRQVSVEQSDKYGIQLKFGEILDIDSINISDINTHVEKLQRLYGRGALCNDDIICQSSFNEKEYLYCSLKKYFQKLRLIGSDKWNDKYSKIKLNATFSISDITTDNMYYFTDPDQSKYKKIEINSNTNYDGLEKVWRFKVVIQHDEQTCLSTAFGQIGDIIIGQSIDEYLKKSTDRKMKLLQKAQTKQFGIYLKTIKNDYNQQWEQKLIKVTPGGLNVDNKAEADAMS